MALLSSRRKRTSSSRYHCTLPLHQNEIAMDNELVSLFWSRVDRSGSCWIYHRPEAQPGETPSRHQSFAGRGAHRFAYEVTNGAIPNGMVICHTCDNPPCVNPNHLVLGSRKDNSRQAFERGRMHRNGKILRLRQRTKPEPEDHLVFRVREFAEQQGLTAAKLARRANLNYNTVAPFFDDQRGDLDPRFRTLERLAGALGVKVSELFPSTKSERALW